MSETQFVKMHHDGEAFGWLGFWICVGLFAIAYSFSSFVNMRHSEIDRTNYNSRRDVCSSMSRFDETIQLQVQDFNYCMENAK